MSAIASEDVDEDKNLVAIKKENITLEDDATIIMLAIGSALPPSLPTPSGCSAFIVSNAAKLQCSDEKYCLLHTTHIINRNQ